MLLRLLRTHLRPYTGLLVCVLVLQFAQVMASLYLPTLNADIVKPRVLWRLVYLVPVVTGCDCSWLFWLTSGTQAASCSAGVRIPIAE